MTLIWNDEAEEEFATAADYYDEQVDGLGEHFVVHIQSAVAKISANPWMPRCFEGDCRRVKIDKFPYFLIYNVEGEQVQIVSVMHTSRRPGYWKSRL
jgi:toxin ParE1/3/4